MTKPFNLANAKAGHPITTSNGALIEILKWEYFRKGGTPLIMGLLNPGTFPEVVYWHFDGDFYGGYSGAGDLVMAPIGQLNGRDIYPGDMLTNSNGDLVPVPHTVPFNPDDWSDSRYPETRMTHGALTQAYNSDYKNTDSRLISVANAAICHGIDNGYLFSETDIQREHQDTIQSIIEITGLEGVITAGDIGAAIRRREVAIARHFLTAGQISMSYLFPYPPPPQMPWAVETITKELTKVKV